MFKTVFERLCFITFSTILFDSSKIIMFTNEMEYILADFIYKFIPTDVKVLVDYVLKAVKMSLASCVENWVDSLSV